MIVHTPACLNRFNLFVIQESRPFYLIYTEVFALTYICNLIDCYQEKAIHIKCELLFTELLKFWFHNWCPMSSLLIIYMENLIYSYLIVLTSLFIVLSVCLSSFGQNLSFRANPPVRLFRSQQQTNLSSQFQSNSLYFVSLESKPRKPEMFLKF